jgi:hypothetical protein
VAVIFPRWLNHFPTAVAIGAPVALVSVIFAITYWFSPEYTDVGYQPDQPVPFSHKLHAGDLAMDCRYCHNTVERGAFAAVPPAQTCMNCHLVIKADSPKLEPIRQAVKTGQAVAWTRVHMLPDYAFFDHSAHLAAGVGCKSCHGRIDQMEVVTQQEPLSMSWCLECHRDPAPNLRPQSELTNMGWDPVAANYDPKKDPARARKVSELRPPEHCSGCHR